MSKGFKVSREEEVCDDEASEMAKAESLERCFAEAQNQKSLDSMGFASWDECRIYASEFSTGSTENFDLNIYTPTGERRSGPAGGCFLGKCPAVNAVRK